MKGIKRDKQNGTCRMGQVEQDRTNRQNRTGRKGQAEQDIMYERESQISCYEITCLCICETRKYYKISLLFREICENRNNISRKAILVRHKIFAKETQP
jgi:hypothetical protein